MIYEKHKLPVPIRRGTRRFNWEITRRDGRMVRPLFLFRDEATADATLERLRGKPS